MGKILYSDNCLGSLRDNISDTDTQAYVNDSHNFPTIAAESTDYYYLTFINDVSNSSETVRVNRSNPNTGLIMFSRAHGGTSAKAFPMGSRVELRMNSIFFDSYDQFGRALPLFSYRIETPNNLPAGWYACDGKEYLKSTVVGKFLANLPATVKSNWRLEETVNTITIPNMYINGVGAMLVPGIPGSIKHETVFGSAAETPTHSYKFSFPTIAMTPAMYFGV